MANKNFLLMSLEDSKTKKIANVVSNDSCRKILDFLSKKEATESEIAEALQLPISTVHYNLQQLMDSELIVSDEFHYSSKGKEVNHYKLANKYIIIAPKSTWGIKEKLKSILPVALIAAGTAGLIQLYTRYFGGVGQDQFAMVAERVEEAAPAAAQKAIESAPLAIEESAKAMAESAAGAAPEVAQQVGPVVSQTTSLISQNIALWFLFGALFALVVYLVWSYFRKEIS
jgi:DNA-binding transcriptional ArsR family regulator